MAYVRGISERGIDYDPATRTFSLREPSAAAEAYLESNFERVPGEAEKWRVRSKITGKIDSFARHMASRARGERASPENIDARREACFGVAGDLTRPPCPEREISPRGASFCKACGCGRLVWARLDGDPSKLTVGYTECPLRRAGFSNAREVPS